MKLQRFSTLAAIPFAMMLGAQVLAASSSLLGEQDYADGTIVSSNATWLAAQSNETPPFNAVVTPAQVILYTHTGLDPGVSGTITFSLWDLDSSSAGNQVGSFLLDNLEQSISEFETNEADSSVKIFQFPVTGSMLADGEVSILIAFGGPADNEVGIDFSRLDVTVPEPSGIAPILLATLFGLRYSRRRLA